MNERCRIESVVISDMSGFDKSDVPLDSFININVQFKRGTRPWTWHWSNHVWNHVFHFGYHLRRVLVADSKSS